MATTTTTTRAIGDIANIELADMGKKRIDWANQSMKVLQIIRKDFIKNQPLKGMRVAACLHVTAETANLALTLRGRRRRCRCAPPTRCPRRRCRRRAWCVTTTSGLRHQGRGQRHLLLAHHGRTRSRAADHDGRRR